MSNRLRIETSSIILVPATESHLKALSVDPEELAKSLGLTTATDWPNPFLLEGAPVVIDQMRDTPEEAGWWIWWIIEKPLAGANIPLRLVGNAGFKGPPHRSGIVELSYSVAKSMEGKGLVTTAVSALMGWAFSFEKVKFVVADSTPENSASQRLLKRCGLRQNQERSPSGDFIFCLSRGQYFEQLKKELPR